MWDYSFHTWTNKETDVITYHFHCDSTISWHPVSLELPLICLLFSSRRLLRDDVSCGTCVMHLDQWLSVRGEFLVRSHALQSPPINASLFLLLSPPCPVGDASSRDSSLYLILVLLGKVSQDELSSGDLSLPLCTNHLSSTCCITCSTSSQSFVIPALTFASNFGSSGIGLPRWAIR